MNKESIISIIIWVVVMSCLGGCAIGNTYSYHDVVADMIPSGDKTISISTHDQREYVVSGKKQPSFIGLQRGGYGNPFNVNTESGKALAEDMTNALAVSLSKKGFKCIPVVVLQSENANTIMQKFKDTSSDFFVLLTLNEWKSDTYTNVALIYDVNLKIYNKTGAILAERSLKGNENLGGNFFNPPAHAKEVVPAAFKQKIEQLFNDAKIVNAVKYEKTSVSTHEMPKDKIKIAFQESFITAEQVKRALDELESPTHSKILDAFLGEQIDGKTFGTLY